mmetsp:Transcript_36149/g.88976  ORF Transcript_36149/g.88976 Transcript_36149/m.88976 type:complete len:203 (-) Transcript_36149:147-755(-)
MIMCVHPIVLKVHLCDAPPPAPTSCGLVDGNEGLCELLGEKRTHARVGGDEALPQELDARSKGRGGRRGQRRVEEHRGIGEESVDDALSCLLKLLRGPPRCKLRPQARHDRLEEGRGALECAVDVLRAADGDAKEEGSNVGKERRRHKLSKASRTPRSEAEQGSEGVKLCTVLGLPVQLSRGEEDLEQPLEGGAEAWATLKH